MQQAEDRTEYRERNTVGSMEAQADGLRKELGDFCVGLGTDGVDALDVDDGPSNHTPNDDWTFWKSLLLSIEKKSKAIEPWRFWTRWVKLDPPFRPSRGVLSQNRYWQLIQEGLSSASNERQKTSLYLFRKSISFLEDVQTNSISFTTAQRQSTQVAVERFCRAYETIVIGCYLHQVRECLKVFPHEFLKARHADHVELPDSWWVALLTGAMASKNLRLTTVVGDWVLDLALVDVTYDDQFGRLLSERLMPWMTTGRLFAESLVRNGELVECKHGNRAQDFISTLLLNCVDQYTVKRYTNAMFNGLFAASKDPRALGFVLMAIDCWEPARWEMLAQGDQFDVRINVELVEKLYRKAPFNRDVKRLCDFHLDSIQCLMESAEFSGALDPELPDDMSSKLLRNIHSVSGICEEINSLQDPKLPWLELLSCADELTNALNAPDIDLGSIQPSSLLATYKKIWYTSEKARFERLSVSKLPGLLYTRSSCMLAQTSADLCKFLADRLIDLQRLSETKLHLWIPLARSIWQTYLEVPGLFDLLPLKQFILTFTNAPPSPIVDQKLDFALGQRFHKLRGFSPYLELANEGQGHAFIFDLLNRLRKADYAVGISIIQTLMNAFTTPNKYGNLPRNLYVLQVVHILAERCLESNHIEWYKDDLMKALSLGYEPRVKFLLEFMLLQLYWERLYEPNWDPNLFLDLIDQLHEDDNFVKYTTAWIRICLNLCRHKKIKESFLLRFANMLPKLCAFDRIVIKREALWTGVHFMDLMQEMGVQSILENQALTQLGDYIKTLKRFREPPKSRIIQQWDPTTERTLGQIFEGGYQLLDLPVPSIITLEYFKNIEKLDETLSQDGQILKRAVPLGISRLPLQVSLPETLEQPTSTVDGVPFQSKSFLGAFEDEPIEKASRKPKKADLILVASLIDSPFNLGGLSRVSDIFGCSALHLPSLSFINDKAFTNVAVSSEKHIHFVETPPSELSALCEQKRREGWTIVGVEQTDSSLILGDSKTILPKKAVIIMGAEKTGIPPDILVECDCCVEIKQWGVTRSLNVQTAAATVLYEWRRQWNDG
jgi:tRNA guanosine-2'-O-methyltransferase